MKIKTLMTSLCVLGMTLTSAFAASGSTSSQNSDQISVDQLSSQADAMQKELAKLRHQVAALKYQQQAKSQTKQDGHYHTPFSPKHPPLTDEAHIRAHTQGTLATYTPPGELSNDELLTQSYLQNIPMDMDNPGRSFVAIGPYVNVPIQFSGSQLIVNDPKINTDVALLKLRKAAHEGMVAKGLHTESETHHSHLLLSGILEGQAQYIKSGQQGGNLGSGKNGSSSNVDLSTAELDGFLLSPSPWVSGFFAFSYSNGSYPAMTNSRVLNSRIFLNNAFIMLGDFTQSPVYGTVGQMFVPFGTYSSVFVTSPLTKTLGRTKARAALIGYQGQTENTFYTALYAFKGDSHASATSRIDNGGVNVGIKFNCPHPDINGDIGAGYIANIADSVGMQNTGLQPMFNGFAGPVPYGLEKIVHRVPALNLRGIVTIHDHINVIGEYIGATTSFNPNDLSFNAGGAKPWSLNAEASYSFEVLSKPTSVGVGYSQAKEALGIGLPEKRMGVVVNTTIWHNTIQSLEFHHDINYAGSKVATGSAVASPIQGMGTYDNVVTLQFDLFF